MIDKIDNWGWVWENFTQIGEDPIYELVEEGINVTLMHLPMFARSWEMTGQVYEYDIDSEEDFMELIPLIIQKRRDRQIDTILSP